jgi:WD40 repeat protein
MLKIPAQTGERKCHIQDAHEDAVTSMEWLPDGSGFLSASLDKTIIQWVCEFLFNFLS